MALLLHHFLRLLLLLLLLTLGVDLKLQRVLPHQV
jgi:hypothetical protein